MYALYRRIAELNTARHKEEDEALSRKVDTAGSAERILSFLKNDAKLGGRDTCWGDIEIEIERILKPNENSETEGAN